jgi:NADH-quinone oxidoreductase subunit F
VDLRLSDAEATAEERESVDGLLGHPTSGWDGGDRIPSRDAHSAHGGQTLRDRRPLLLPALHAVQSRVGWISEGALNYICERLAVAPAEVWGVATFYALLATTPRPRRVLHVCDDIACRTSGAKAVIDGLERAAGPAHHPEHNGHPVEIPEDGAIWLRSPCLGLCDQAPAALLTVAGDKPIERLFGGVSAELAQRVLAGDIASSDVSRPKPPQLGSTSLRLLRRVGSVEPESLDAYIASGGYQALRRAFEIGAEAVRREVTDSKLLGRGGAAFPTGRKWEAVAREPARPHYVICNADESEPGTFKDRVLLEGDPFAIIEAMTIAAFAVSAERGYVYIRGEYPLAVSRIQNAIDLALARGFLGPTVMARDFRFELEVRKGAGAYICGEETALFNSIEGFRGEPRNKPPFPTQAGLFRRPTVVNNVETLANVLEIVLEGGQAFAKTGTEQSAGTRLFCVSGAVKRRGVYEVPFGATLRDLLKLAGGTPNGRTIQAILLGGAAGAFVGPDDLDIPLTFEGVRAAKATLGSGVILVFDDSVDMRDILLRIAAFFRDESCGQCVPCRVGTVRQEEALYRLAKGRPRGTVGDELALIREIGSAMQDASICGLGATAYSAIESAIERLGLFSGSVR